MSKQVYKKEELNSLITLAQSGDIKALEEIIRRVQKQVYATFFHLTDKKEDVLDLTYWEKPAVVRPDAISKIIIEREGGDPRKDYGTFESSNPFDNDLIMQKTIVSRGWDPVDGYADTEHHYPDVEGYEDGDPIDPKDSPRIYRDEDSP